MGVVPVRAGKKHRRGQENNRELRRAEFEEQARIDLLNTSCSTHPAQHILLNTSLESVLADPARQTAIDLAVCTEAGKQLGTVLAASECVELLTVTSGQYRNSSFTVSCGHGGGPLLVGK